MNSGLTVKTGEPLKIWQKLITEFEIGEVHFNRDYEPYAIERDKQTQRLFQKNKIASFAHKDQTIFEPNEIVKAVIQFVKLMMYKCYTGIIFIQLIQNIGVENEQNHYLITTFLCFKQGCVIC